ncbi:MAG: glycosyltransferase family 4 protein [bacterium]|nr:glycosyltransferase family 4 protein [bacterium]
MRIAHVVSTYPPYRGGQGNVAREIAERTAAQGREVVVVTPRRRIMNHESRIMDRDRSHDSLFRIHYSSPRLRFGNAAWCPSIARTLEDLRPDVVHFHWPFIGGLVPVLRWRMRDARRRLVVQYHMDLIADGWRGAVFAGYQRRALPQLLAHADRVVASSLDYAQHGALAPFVDVPGERLVEIPLGVDVERFMPLPIVPPTHPLPLPLRTRGRDLPEGGVETEKHFSHSRVEGEREGVEMVALFVGGLDRAHAFKGLTVLLDAIARTSNVYLRVVGDGDLRSVYEQQTRALGIADRVEFLGSVPDSDLPSVYQNAGVLVLPSTARSEAFGVVLLEAMSSGLPVITSDLPGVRTVVDHGRTGYLVPINDPGALAERILALAADPKRVARMGTMGRARVLERYQWEHIVRTWLRVYDELV